MCTDADRPAKRRIDWRRLVGALGLLLLTWVYCQPGHPSAGRAAWLDAALHVGLFAVVGFCWARSAGRGPAATVGLVALAGLLEVLQWWRGAYAAPEYWDIGWNVLGAWIGRQLATPRAQTARKLD